jgi:hypothetical protein
VAFHHLPLHHQADQFFSAASVRGRSLTNMYFEFAQFGTGLV